MTACPAFDVSVVWPSYLFTTIPERLSHFCGGAEFFWDNRKIRAGFNINTSTSRASYIRKIVVPLDIACSKKGVPTSTHELDIYVREILQEFYAKNDRPDYLSRCLSHWAISANYRTGWKRRYSEWLPLSSTSLINYRTQRTDGIVEAGCPKKGKQQRTPITSELLKPLALWVMENANRLQSKLPPSTYNIWKLQGSKWAKEFNAEQQYNDERVLQHCTGTVFAQPSRSGGHCWNLPEKKMSRTDPVSGRKVAHHWRISFFHKKSLQSELPPENSRACPIIIQGTMLFGRKNDKGSPKANFKCHWDKHLNPFFYWFRRNDWAWSRHWFHNKRMWKAIEDQPNNRLVPFYSWFYKQHKIDKKTIYRNYSCVRYTIKRKREMTWSANSFSKHCKDLIKRFMNSGSVHLQSIKNNTWKMTYKFITGHSGRYEYVFREFLLQVTDSSCIRDEGMLLLQAELGWSDKQMLKVYGLFKDSQLGKIQNAVALARFRQELSTWSNI